MIRRQARRCGLPAPVAVLTVVEVWNADCVGAAAVLVVAVAVASVGEARNDVAVEPAAEQAGSEARARARAGMMARDATNDMVTCQVGRSL